MGAAMTTFAILILVLACVAVILEKAYFYVPLRELERRAHRGDGVSAALGRVATYDGQAHLLLVSLTVVLSVAGLVWLAYLVPWFVTAVVAVVFIVGAFFWLPRTRLHATEARLAAWCAPALAWVLMQFQPALRPVVAFGGKMYKRRTHTGIFELADLAELFQHQVHQRDNRISPADLARIQSLLGASSHTVRDGMTPARRVMAVDVEDEISPVLIDELHRSGQLQFPVYEGGKTNVIGTLTIERIADVHQHGSIGDNIDRHLAYVHEDDGLEHALRAFYETHQQLLIVVNGAGKYVGVIALTDILQQLLGGLENKAFGRYDDRDAVVRRHVDRKKSTEVVE